MYVVTLALGFTYCSPHSSTLLAASNPAVIGAIVYCDGVAHHPRRDRIGEADADGANGAGMTMLVR